MEDKALKGCYKTNLIIRNLNETSINPNKFYANLIIKNPLQKMDLQIIN